MWLTYSIRDYWIWVLIVTAATWYGGRGVTCHSSDSRMENRRIYRILENTPRLVTKPWGDLRVTHERGTSPQGYSHRDRGSEEGPIERGVQRPLLESMHGASRMKRVPWGETPAGMPERVVQEPQEERQEWLRMEGPVQGGPQDEKRYLTTRSHHLDDYLYWMRSGECPQREDGVHEFFCPTPDKRTGRWVCVNDAQLCDQMRDCPNGEDELGVHCLFYHVIQSHIGRLTQSLIWRARERDP